MCMLDMSRFTTAGGRPVNDMGSNEYFRPKNWCFGDTKFNSDNSAVMGHAVFYWWHIGNEMRMNAVM